MFIYSADNNSWSKVNSSALGWTAYFYLLPLLLTSLQTEIKQVNKMSSFIVKQTYRYVSMVTIKNGGA